MVVFLYDLHTFILGACPQFANNKNSWWDGAKSHWHCCHYSLYWQTTLMSGIICPLVLLLSWFTTAHTVHCHATLVTPSDCWHRTNSLLSLQWYFLTDGARLMEHCRSIIFHSKFDRTLRFANNQLLRSRRRRLDLLAQSGTVKTLEIIFSPL